MAPGLRHFTDIAADGAPLQDAASGEELVRVDHAASLALGSRAPEAPGTLFVTTRVIWLSDAEKGKGFAVDFLDITLHAVSRDLEAYPSPCIYTQISSLLGFVARVQLRSYHIVTDIHKIETEVDTDEEADESDPGANGELDLSRVSEMRIIPSDPSQQLSVDELFDVFCHCAELNPDPNSEGTGENGWFHGEDMAAGGWVHGDDDMVDENDLETHPIGQNGGYDLNLSINELQINDQRFEDAEEEPESRDNGH
ncbi:hypothetical protein PR202_gb19236 [Eleusine coracana subsp. coracana]|uniref:Chloride conductance regulatory protein ICln n=1 Tax=Eleusine coracana subsp. coracana TaxID=191504 RepID=A0AAV5F7F4_ELECO|nr:hypothetical protein PR202_gb19236 [Eleusine coracana subsp. coracana]